MIKRLKSGTYGSHLLFWGHEIRLNCVCIVAKRLTCCPSVCLSPCECIVIKQLKSASYRFTSVLRSWNQTKLCVYCDKTAEVRFTSDCMCTVTERLTYCPSVYRYASVLWQNGWSQVHTGSHLFCGHEIRLNFVYIVTKRLRCRPSVCLSLCECDAMLSEVRVWCDNFWRWSNSFSCWESQDVSNTDV